MVLNFCFCWQIYAVNKRSYETARQILVIQIIPGMCDLNVMSKAQHNNKNKEGMYFSQSS